MNADTFTVSWLPPCIFSEGCVNHTRCKNQPHCLATGEELMKEQRKAPWRENYHVPAGVVTGTLDLDQCRAMARNAADAYRIIQELGGAKHLKVVALNRCAEIMDACEKVTGEMDGRPDK